MAVDFTREYFRRRDLDCGFAALFLVHDALRQLQQDLWVSRCGGRLHDLDLDLHHWFLLIGAKINAELEH
jgi:hypothetical protein